LKTIKLLAVWSLLLLGGQIPGVAQFTLSGLSDKGVYNDSVTFTVSAQAGYQVGAALDGQVVALGAATKVGAVDYHELRVSATNQTTLATTNAVFRFNVVSTERNGSENGLPPWIPYPSIPSTAQETAGAHLRCLLPAAFPTNLPVPVVAWVEGENGAAVRANGFLAIQPQASIQVRRGAGSGFLPGYATVGETTVAGQFNQMDFSRTVQVDSNTTWSSVSGDLSGTVTWPAQSWISVVGEFRIPAGAALTIGPGTVVRLAPGVSVAVVGQLTVNGTEEAPVVFTPWSPAQPWGGFFLTNSTSALVANAAIFTGSGANASAVANSHRHEQCLFYLDNHARLALTNCAAIYLAGQFGHGVDRGLPWNQIDLVHTLIQRCTTGGEWNGSALKLLQSALIETPYERPVFNDGDEDGIYFTTGAYEVRDSLIGWNADDGLDAGSGDASSVTVSNTWVEGSYHEAFAWSGGNRKATNWHTVSLNCGQGIECGYSLSAPSPDVYAFDCLSTANLIGARFGDNYNWTYTGFLRVTNSLLLYNYRDVWGMNWSDWTYRTDLMDVRGNWLTAPNPKHTENLIWNPVIDGARLAAFMSTPPTAEVGIGLAVRTRQFPLGAISNALPVRLSSFTTLPVSFGYRYASATETLAEGRLEFAPGETLKLIPAPAVSLSGNPLVRLQLLSPQQGQITGESTVWFGTLATATGSTLISTGAVWRYLDTGANAGTAWRERLFEDSAWASGRAELGYGDSKDGRPETTVINSGLNATNTTNRYITYYFRHSFLVNNPEAVGPLTVQLKRDDGGIVYLNGTEIFRSNLADGPVDYLTRATLASDDGVNFYSTNAPASLLVPGTNVVAVEIHQESPTSSDVSFDLRLDAAAPLRLEPVRFGSGWLLSWDSTQGTLEQAPDLAGPWTASAQSSPAEIQSADGRAFYRLKKLSGAP